MIVEIKTDQKICIELVACPHSAQTDRIAKVLLDKINLRSEGYGMGGIAELEVYPAGDPYSDDYVSEIWISLRGKK